MNKTLSQILLDKYVKLTDDKLLTSWEKELYTNNYAKSVKILESYQHKKQVLEELKGFVKQRQYMRS